MAELQEITQEALRLHQKAGGFDSAPIDMTQLIYKAFKKCFVGAADLGAVEGALVTEMGRAAFYFRENDSANTRNFVLAHLVWHYIRQSKRGQLDLTRQCYITSTRPPTAPNLSDERDADIFATEVLVPLDLLENVVDFSANPSNQAEKQILKEKTAMLADLFGVPEAVMSRRLAIFAARRKHF